MLFTDMSAELPVFTIAGRGRDHAAREDQVQCSTCRFRKWQAVLRLQCAKPPSRLAVAVAQFGKNALMLPYEVIGERGRYRSRRRRFPPRSFITAAAPVGAKAIEIGGAAECALLLRWRELLALAGDEEAEAKPPEPHKVQPAEFLVAHAITPSMALSSARVKAATRMLATTPATKDGASKRPRPGGA